MPAAWAVEDSLEPSQGVKSQPFGLLHDTGRHRGKFARFYVRRQSGRTPLKDSCRRSCRPRGLASHLLTAEVRAVSIKRDGQVYKAAHHRPAEKHCRDPLRPQSAGAAMGQHGVNKGGMMGQDQYYSNPWPSPRRKLRTCLAKTHVPMDGILRMIPGPGEEAQRCPA